MDWGNTVPDKHGALIPRDSEQEGFIEMRRDIGQEVENFLIS